MRGSTPCHDPELVRYGGNTSCVSLSIPGHRPILFDLGTGLRYFGERQCGGGPFEGACLLSHVHWDHIQGLPFFAPLMRDDSVFDVYAPVQADGTSVEQVFADTIRPPVFPVHHAELPGRVHFHEVERSDFSIGDATVMARPIPHIGPTVGYRVTWEGTSVAYLSDHQMPVDGSFSVSDDALELCAGADLLIHDAQYTPAEFARKRNWGHCTIEYAVWVAAQAGVRTLALFHHDPAHHDDMLDVIVRDAVACGEPLGVEVIAAREGLRVALTG